VYAVQDNDGILKTSLLQVDDLCKIILRFISIVDNKPLLIHLFLGMQVQDQVNVE